jgi:thioester reductase-like protein
MWAGSIQLQALPRINCFIDFTPVDYVAKAIAYLALQQNSLGKAFHLTNPSPMHSIKAYAWLRSKGYEFEELPLEEWRQRLMNNNHFAENALYPYAAVLEDFEEVNLNFPVYDCQQTLQALEGSSIQCPPLDEKLLATYLDFFIRIGFLSPPSVATPKVLTTFD